MARRLITFTIPLALLFTSCLPPHNISRGGWMFSGTTRKGIVSTAKRYIGIPYRHGGETPRGFDCSGYVMYVYGKNGIDLPRSADDQYRDGRKVSMSKAGPADLVFFRTRGRKISHVGIYLGKDRFIHAPSTGKQVSVASMNNRYWKRRFAGAVSYL